MAVTISVQITDEEAARLDREAKRRGTTVDQILQVVVPEQRAAQLGADEMVSALRRIAQKIPASVPVLSSEQWRRESLYSMEEE